MIRIETFVVNMIRENCYVVSDESGEAVIIDCGAYYDKDKRRIREYIAANRLSPKRLICTHGHFDHVMGSRFICDEYGLKPELPPEDIGLYNSCERQLAVFAGLDENLRMPEACAISRSEKIRFGTHALSVIPVPGHTPGGTAFYCAEEDAVFSGDSLFYGSIGRTDFPYGDERLLTEKLKENLLTLPESVRVFPGHDRPTSIGFEKRSNPYLTAL